MFDFLTLFKISIFLLAALKGHLQVVQIFMEKLIDKNPVGGRYSGTPLHFAAEEGHMEVMNCLLNEVEDKNPQDANGRTPLHNLVK